MVQRRRVFPLMMIIALCVIVGCGPPSSDATASPPPEGPSTSGQAEPDVEAPSPGVSETGGQEQTPPEKPVIEQPPEESVLDRMGELPDTQEELVQRWHEEAERARTDPSNTAYQAIAYKLRNMGPETLLPLLDILGDPAEEPFVKVCVVRSIRGQAHDVLVAPLLELAGPEHDVTTRACATDLLGEVLTDETLATLRKLAQAPERRIRLAALRGLVRGGEPEGRRGFAAMWNDPSTTVRERNEIGRTLANDIQHDKENVDIMMKAVTDFELDVAVRRDGIAALGRALDPKAIPALELSAEKDPDENVREIAASAIRLIKSRGNRPKE